MAKYVKKKMFVYSIYKENKTHIGKCHITLVSFTIISTMSFLLSQDLHNRDLPQGAQTLKEEARLPEVPGGLLLDGSRGLGRF